MADAADLSAWSLTARLAGILGFVAPTESAVSLATKSLPPPADRVVAPNLSGKRIWLHFLEAKQETALPKHRLVSSGSLRVQIKADKIGIQIDNGQELLLADLSAKQFFKAVNLALPIKTGFFINLVPAQRLNRPKRLSVLKP
jgi:hypothetical protein